MWEAIQSNSRRSKYLIGVMGVVLVGLGFAIGMVFAASVATQASLAEPDVGRRLRDLLARAGLPTELPDISGQRQAYLDAIGVDKKVRSAKVGFVVLREIGRAEQVRMTPDEIVAGLS